MQKNVWKIVIVLSQQVLLIWRGRKSPSPYIYKCNLPSGLIKYSCSVVHCIYMGESFQDYSWIQDFEADFP